MADTRLIDGIRSIAEASGELTEWSLIIIAGTIVTIVSTSYLRPISNRVRLVYLLFVPGWLSLFYSNYKSYEITRRIAASIFSRKEEVVFKIAKQINIDFFDQLLYFKIGVSILGVWLVLFFNMVDFWRLESFYHLIFILC